MAPKPVGKAKRAVTAALPELAAAETALAALGSGRKAPRHHLVPEDGSTVTFEAPAFILKPPRVYRKKGVTVVVGPQGLTGKEVAALGAVGGVGVAAVYVYEKFKNSGPTSGQQSAQQEFGIAPGQVGSVFPWLAVALPPVAKLKLPGWP